MAPRLSLQQTTWPGIRRAFFIPGIRRAFLYPAPIAGLDEQTRLTLGPLKAPKGFTIPLP